MSAPYWGELPQPKGIHDRRMSEDYSFEYSNPDQRQSLDNQPPRKTNRASVQTTYTEAPTETTFSPNSPTSSTVAPHGLAPRPPSFHRGSAQDTGLEGYDKKTRRPNRIPDELDDPYSPAPAAPEISRGPPVSYRGPYPNGGYPYAHPSPTSTRAPRQPVVQSQAEGMAPEEYFPQQRQDGLPHASQRPIDDAAARRASVVAAQSTKAPASGTYERRKKFAADRSPLQRLELTLDSMTKEEKRARVEAAEQRARQRAALRAANQPSGDPMQIRDRQPSTTQERHLAAPIEIAVPMTIRAPLPHEEVILRDSPAHKAPAPQHVQEQHRRHLGPNASQPPRTSVVQQPVGPEPVIPTRNLSFRERTIRDDERLPSAETSQPQLQSPPPNQSGKPSSVGVSLTRSGSNKLRKEPPADAWHRIRMEAEKRAPAVPQHGPLNDAVRPPPQECMQIPPKSNPQHVRGKELPPTPVFTADQVIPPPVVGSRFPVPAAGPDVQGIQRRATEPIYGREDGPDNEFAPPVARGRPFNQADQRPLPVPPDAAASGGSLQQQVGPGSSDGSNQQHMSRMVIKRPEDLRPGDGLYQSPKWLDEWKKGTVGTLSGTLLDLSSEQPGASDKNAPWWEQGGHRRTYSVGSRPRKAEAFDGEYDDTNAPTRFKPPLYLKCGPLLRYCGMRQEKIPTRPRGTSVILEREIWRGSVMIVTNDAESSYEIAPTLRLFVQDIELLPPPPHHVNGDLPPEYVDPIAGHPKLGRRGETLYVRPVEHLEEAKDLSRDESEGGLFEKTRSPPDDPLPNGLTDLPGSYAGRRRRVDTDGEKMQKYKDVRGFRLHAEQGCIFWRFNIEVELREKQQRVAYRINRGPAMAFWVPARGQTMNMMFYSCNGFGANDQFDELSGPDPMWRDVLISHQTQPFHAMIGGGNQIYNNCVADECDLFDEWLDIGNPLHKHNTAFTAEMQSQLERFYLERYCTWFSQGLFGLANSQIPMVNMLDDHDIFEGYGSYAHPDMISPVFSGLGAVAFKYYMLFQHQSIVTETENSEPSWILGEQPGPYVHEFSRSLYMSMGGKVALLAVDGRTERTQHTVVDEKTWEKMMNRLYAEVRRGQVEHLLVLMGVPVAYPRLEWLENLLTSRLMSPVKVLGKTGLLGKTMHNIDRGYELLDDLNDHWSTKNHKQERTVVIEDLQDLAIDKSLRVTILSGDVHMAAVGQFYSNPKLGLAKHKDPRYMPNIISSPIANSPPPGLIADILNKRNKVYHFDKQTDESMIPIFQNGVDGKSRSNKHFLPHRNWCSIRMWAPGNTPPPSPPLSSGERSPSPPSSGGSSLFRRLSRGRSSSTNRFEASRESVRGPRPPISGGGGGSGGLFRSLSRRNSVDTQRPGLLKRALSLGRGESRKKSEPVPPGRPSSQRQNDGSVNGQWDAEYDDDAYMDARAAGEPRLSGLRGGGTFDEYSEGDESLFTAQPAGRAQTLISQTMAAASRDSQEPAEDAAAPISAFHRTPTGLSTKQMRQAEKHAVDLEGGLDICLNVEVNPKDPTGITMPYRILVPKLFYEYSPDDDSLPAAGPSGIKKLLSFRKKPQQKVTAPPAEEADESDGAKYDDQ